MLFEKCNRLQLNVFFLLQKVTENLQLISIIYMPFVSCENNFTLTKITEKRCSKIMLYDMPFTTQKISSISMKTGIDKERKKQKSFSKIFHFYHAISMLNKVQSITFCFSWYNTYLIFKILTIFAENVV